jgi:outer membrane protein TolC
MTASSAELDLANERVDVVRRISEMVAARYREADASESEYLDAQDDVLAAELELSLIQMRLRLAEAAWLWCFSN